VSQHFTHPDNIRTLTDQMLCECVSDIVQRSGFDAGLFKNTLEIYADNIVRIKRLLG
jgi:hypothetical protein